MIQYNLPKVNITKGCFKPTKIIEYNKPINFNWDEFQIQEIWLDNSINLADRLKTTVCYINHDGGENERYITGLTTELKEDGLYVAGNNIPNIQDGEYIIGYSFNAENDEWLNVHPTERKISKGTICSISLLKEEQE